MTAAEAHSPTILITGGAGFTGSNFVYYFCRQYPQYQVLVLDKLTQDGSMDNLKVSDGLDNYSFVKGDICDAALLSSLFAQKDIRGVINFAAETNVSRSVSEPQAFVDTNAGGTACLLNAACRHWMTAPGSARPGYEDCRFHQISTDEVYGSLKSDHNSRFHEDSPLHPGTPYAASKASADLLVGAWVHTYGLNATISRCSNNYGPRQSRLKLIPAVITACMSGLPVTIYGDGRNKREWLHVSDHNRAVDAIFHKGKSGRIYNVGSNEDIENIVLAERICEMLDGRRPRKDGKSYKEQITFTADRPANDLHYAVDSSRLRHDLGWRSEIPLDEGLGETVDWYLQ